MFTGLVQAVGRIERVERRGAGAHLIVQAAPLDLSRLAVGGSVAVNGCCLTVTAIDGTRFHADLSEETLARTANLDRCGPVNLERSLAVGDPIDGHLVSGHVDAAGTVIGVRTAPDSHELELRAPPQLAPYLAFKGSLAVDGVSLTINRVQDVRDGCDVAISLIPHTLQVTTLGQLSVGQRVNLEVDSLARYAERIVALISRPSVQDGGVESGKVKRT